ncbi:hypothetical protein JCM19239_3126 [Vibrio variabilis]|uniref:Uncharacterized protein n=1 Tax=Vibrio variabilis TaxID=990271 RepID=A0ABQ0JP43_9VIBR|nr:hypothetical protein JCM19239_3126 [Vibrio variabilis]
MSQSQRMGKQSKSYSKGSTSSALVLSSFYQQSYFIHLQNFDD